MKETGKFITTNQLAPTLGVKPQTIVRSLCVNGHYLGMKPIKLPNGRLLWSTADRDRLLNGEAA